MKKLVILSLAGIASVVLTSSIITNARANEPAGASDSVTHMVKDMDASIVWTGSKITGGSHTGTLAVKENLLEFKGNDLVGGSFTIDMNSIANTDLSGGSAEKLVGHLKSDDFFGVATYPTSRFKITEVKPGNDTDEFMVTGDLTIKSTTQPISFPVSMKLEGNQATASATITVDRADYDVRFGSGRFFDGLGDRAINDEFKLEVRIVSNSGR